MSLDTIMDIFRVPHILPPYPNHTQGVERMVRVITEVATKRAGYTARHRYKATCSKYKLYTKNIFSRKVNLKHF